MNPSTPLRASWRETIAAAWEWLTKTRYTRALERENAALEGELERLKQDNRALMNSLLGTAGFAPVELPRKLGEIPRLRRRSWHQMQRHAEREGQEKANGE